MNTVEVPLRGQPFTNATMHWNSPDGERRYLVEFYTGADDYTANIEYHRVRASKLYLQILGFDPIRTSEDIRRNMQVGRGGSIYFARTLIPDLQDVAFVSQRIMEVEEARVLYVSTKVVLSEHQQSGLGTLFVEQANFRHNPDVFVGRTQNPNIIRTLKRTGLFEKIYPIDGLYPPEMEKTIEIVGEKTRNPGVNLRTGLCVGVYPPGESRAFVLDTDNDEVVKIYNIMTGEKIGMDPTNGDAIIYWALLKQGNCSDPEE